MHPHWIKPDWPVAAGVHAVFTTRHGGVSPAPWDSLNLGDHVGDDLSRVHANRQSLQNAIGRRAVFLKQVHGADVLTIDPATADGLAFDACVTSHRQVACTIMVADCLPVLLASADGRHVGAAHAGWRGLAGGGAMAAGLRTIHAEANGVLEAVCGSLRALAQSAGASDAINTRASEDVDAEHIDGLIAWLGPCIGPAAFEVGAEVKSVFDALDGRAAACFVAIDNGKYLADLAGLARLRLAALGVTKIYGNDSSADWCTVSNPSQFFSHRRDAGISGASNGFGTTGRMAACIWLD